MKKLGDAALTFILCAVIGALCVLSADAKSGARSGIKMCEEIIIPSLLPVLIICNLIIKTKCSAVLEKLLGRAFEKLFCLPAASVPAVIGGLTGGFPTGAVLTCELYKSGAVDAQTASRIMRFNFCGGYAFIITAVGTVTYGSTKTGAVLYLVNIISAVIIMFCGRGGGRIVVKKDLKRKYPAFSEALPLSAETSVKALAVMSAYIILFSAVCNILKVPQFLMPLAEITNGICLAKQPLPLPLCAFFLSFGGICIHFQLFGILKSMRVKYTEFLFFRIMSAVISFFLMKLYLYVFPQQTAVFGNLSSGAHTFSSGGLELSALMIIGCAVLVFDIENKKLKLI